MIDSRGVLDGASGAAAAAPVGHKWMREKQRLKEEFHTFNIIFVTIQTFFYLFIVNNAIEFS